MPAPRRHGKGEPFILPHAKRDGKVPGPETLKWYWHPQRDGVRFAPQSFRDQLHAIDPLLEVTFSPVHERYLLWVKNPRIQHPICVGWQLLMVWEHPQTHEHLPLNELMFHNIYMISAGRYDGAKDYYDRIQADIARQKEARNAKYEADRKDLQDELHDGLKISSAGKGNKFALHHDGTVVPSMSEMNWRADTRKTRLPADLLQQEKDDREKAEYGR